MTLNFDHPARLYKYWDYRPAPPYLVYVALRIVPRATSPTPNTLPTEPQP